MFKNGYLVATAAVFACAFSGAVAAQQYPSGDLHFICGFPAGSGADAIVRFYAEKLKPITGRNIIVENRPGAGANIAIEYVAKAKPDGLTILVHGGSGFAANMHLYKEAAGAERWRVPDICNYQQASVHDGGGRQQAVEDGS